MPLVLALLLGACGEKAGEEPAAAAPQTKSPAAAPAVAALPRTPAPEGARVFFVSPADGATVSNPVRIVFGIEGMSVAPAGDDTPHSGHHHVIIDADLPDLGMPIPATENYVHFGDGRTETELTLDPGKHTLQMLLGDHMHIPHDPPLTSGKITIFVE
ncbi:MAG: DUF4399 domain-containing protein [Gammaproteobacteria bacterium]|nr:DUF4399 domain-containing protein [Gammaproteobacteria bacterium]NNF48764.1 DUF4399 domain-containing protein [Woeseiaceae bacterium]MBT8094609.1 DUF4399 domain-containing protein [Gammaproteobacteria bacterium]MBT8106374.1 DUF4399 domain-containing protein [Gammaproteobacteria bacterium]NNK26389.1 DUF4399 domain-containing protein [Woeseiaceae bacterium]